MNSSLSHFKATLQRRKERTEKKKGRFNKIKNGGLNISNVKTEYDFPKLSPYKLKKLKEDIRRRGTLRRRKGFIVFIIVLIILFSTVFILN